MTKSSTIRARIEPELKDNAESVLSSLGLTPSAAINMFYKQIVLQNGMPFDIKIPNQTPVRQVKSVLPKVESDESFESLDSIIKKVD